MLILNCENLISSCCSDYALAKSLSIVNNILQLIHIIIPILLIIMAIKNLIELMQDPLEKKLVKKLMNKVLATIIIFFIPTIVNATLKMVSNSNDIYACLKAGSQLETMAKNDEIIYQTITEEKKYSIISNPKDYEKGEKEENITNNNDYQDSSISSNGNILLIAGHSYSPYCSQGGLGDCRGVSARSGYAEEVETRKLVKLIKSNLDNLGVKSDIANAMMAGDNDKMNKSFFIESRLNTALFNKFDWNHYKFVLEVHFNATSGSPAQGTLLCKKSSSYNTPADNDIVNAVISHTGNRRLQDSIQPLNNVSYFTKRNIPIVYLETEFYDNASAMKKYTAQINGIARDIALAIQKHYG